MATRHLDNRKDDSFGPSYFGDAGRGRSEIPRNSSVQSACFRPERGSLSGLAKLHSIYCWWVQLLAYVDLASCGECTMAQCKHITKSLAITKLDLNISRNRRPKSSRNVWFRCRNLEHLLTWKDSHSAKHTTWTLTKESTVSVSQQSGVLDQQLRKLLSSPGLPAVSPIALPLLSAHGEGRGAICCFPDLRTTIPYRTLRIQLPRQQEWVSSQRWLCTKMSETFCVLGGKAVLKWNHSLWIWWV